MELVEEGFRPFSLEYLFSSGRRQGSAFTNPNLSIFSSLSQVSVYAIKQTVILVLLRRFTRRDITNYCATVSHADLRASSLYTLAALLLVAR
jgi:hypothetical protein